MNDQPTVKEKIEQYFECGYIITEEEKAEHNRFLRRVLKSRGMRNNYLIKKLKEKINESKCDKTDI